jgi:uncharacterized 2Fe-2S/4Fe-4S cluster protein (DUF4445 family)
VITSDDVRAVQLAKAALHAAVHVLLMRIGGDTLDRVVIAGVFGSHINAESAMSIGMLPRCPPSKLSFLGDAALAGAKACLFDRDTRACTESFARKVEHIELSCDATFQELFVSAMAFP